MRSTSAARSLLYTQGMRLAELVVPFALVFVACSSGDPSDPGPKNDGTPPPAATPPAAATGPTFHKDVEPILQRVCQNCHVTGGIAPFTLLTYDDARA